MKTRRILSTVLALVFVLSTLTVGSLTVSAAVTEVYVDQTNGDDSAAGTVDAPVKSLGAAFTKLGGAEGTVYIMGVYNSEATWPSSSSEVTISGYDETSQITCAASLGIYFKSDLVFENINISLGTNAHFNSEGNKITFGEGLNMASGMIHVGGHDGGSTESEHIVIDGGCVFSKTATIGGAYSNNSPQTINGDVTVEVLDGTLATLMLSQDGWQDSHKTVYIGGNLNVRVGSKGKINAMTNGGRAAILKGYMQVIVEEGGSMCDPVLTNCINKEYYWVNLPDTVNGNVEFTDRAGVVNITANDGYVVAVTYDNKTEYVAPGEYTLPLGKKVTVSFDNSKVVGPSSADLTIEPATPGESEWPVSVDKAEFEIFAEAITPSDSVVDYGVAYTYDIVLTPAEGYVFPGGFTFTINGKEPYSKENLHGYRIRNYVFGSEKITFTYTADITAGEDGKTMVSYEGGIGSALMAGATEPSNAFYAPGETITVEENFYVQGGYKFVGYSDGSKVYQPGDEYIVGDTNVVFTAQWEILEPIVIVFQGNGETGGFAPDSIESYEGMYVTVPNNTFAKTGFNFTYWTDSEGNIYYPGDLLMTPGSNVTLTANWEENLNTGKIIYVDSNNGSASNDGLTADTAVDSIVNAYALADGGDITIIVVNSAEIKGELPISAGVTTITGMDRESVLNISGGVALGGETVIENIGVNPTNGAYIASNGNKAVIGPNLTGGKIDFVDGGIAKTVGAEDATTVDTTIKSGVHIGTYYLGGSDLSGSDQGIVGNVMVNIDGAVIDTLDFAPKNSETAKIDGYIIFNVNAGSTINSFKASKSYQSAKENNHVMMLFFNGGTIPTINNSVINTLLLRSNYVFITDSGIGGTVAPDGTPTTRGRAIATADVGDAYYCTNTTGTYTKATAGRAFALRNINTGVINKVRYGEESKDNIDISIASPTGGAEAFSITADSSNPNCKVQISGWEPALVGGKFSYDTVYSADVIITPNIGVFFNENKLPSVTINGVAVTASANTDGTISASYKFTEQTGYAPLINVSFDAGDPSVTGTIPSSREWEHMSTGNILPSAASMTNLGFRFAGWRCSIDNKLYPANSSYSVTGNFDIVFTAEWQQRGSWELPNVIILYDLTAYATDKGRNPEFDASDDPIRIEDAFANLEHEINGTKGTKKAVFDYEDVTVIESDGGSNPIKINNWTLDKGEADPSEYKYMTIVYYYESETGAAVGSKGQFSFGNCKLPDGSTSAWYGTSYESINTVVANKWAAVVFDFSDIVAAKSIPEGSLIRQFHICPIGTKTCSELAGDKLYLKDLYFSKLPPVVE